MSKILWDQVGEKQFETGIDHGVLYPQASDGSYPLGYGWNGLTSVAENPSGAEDNALYADNIKYLNLKSAEEFGATIGCYYYPDAWEECDGTATVAKGVKMGQQKRRNFGLSYRTLKGNDVDGQDHGYKIHLVYNCSASPSEKSYGSVNDSPDAIEFSYEVTTTPITVEGYKPTSLITIDSTEVDADKLAEFEKILYGTDASDGVDGTDPRLPLPTEVIAFFAEG